MLFCSLIVSFGFYTLIFESAYINNSFMTVQYGPFPSYLPASSLFDSLIATNLATTIIFFILRHYVILWFLVLLFIGCLAFSSNKVANLLKYILHKEKYYRGIITIKDKTINKYRDKLYGTN